MPVPVPHKNGHQQQTISAGELMDWLKYVHKDTPVCALWDGLIWPIKDEVLADPATSQNPALRAWYNGKIVVLDVSS